MMNFLREPLTIERLTIAIADLPPNLEKLKLVHLCDFHYDGICLSEAQLLEVISLTQRENPDLILLTGDYITHDPTTIKELAIKLKILANNYPILASLGNHDQYFPHSRLQITEALTKIGIKVLWNEITYPFGPGLAVIGLADYWSNQFQPDQVFTQIDNLTPRLVLSHNPDTASILKQWRVDLQLSGHTHGSQIIIPGLGPALKIIQTWQKQTPPFLHSWIPLLNKLDNVIENWQWIQGWHQIGKNQLYVNRGLGTYFPGRLFCPPELTVITLVSQNG
jgi:predicted MPP superfamily phosphohydrolase